MENSMTSLTLSLRTTFAAVLAMLPLATPARAEAIAPTSPSILVVEKLHAALLGVMKDATRLGYQGRYERLAPILMETYDTAFMAEKSVGRHWNLATPADQAALVETFSRFMVANYAGRFDGYAGEHFEILGEDPSAQGTVLVRSRLVEKEDEGVQLNYRLRPVDGSWKIIDVYLNGTVSELALRRSEYTSLIKRDGWQAVLTALDARIHDLSTAPPPKNAKNEF
jgi:phospholipid transport system substrate-binding protein